MPNWYIHLKWALKAGVSETVTHVVNRSIDYGASFAFFPLKKNLHGGDDRRYQELWFMYEKDPVHLEYITAYYMHFLLDHLKETKKKELKLALQEYKAEKALMEITDDAGRPVRFTSLVDGLISLLLEHEAEVNADIHGC
nr:hypothetical protein [Candidatus Sigynarchaeota archaeon]